MTPRVLPEASFAFTLIAVLISSLLLLFSHCVSLASSQTHCFLSFGMDAFTACEGDDRFPCALGKRISTRTDIWVLGTALLQRLLSFDSGGGTSKSASQWEGRGLARGPFAHRPQFLFLSQSDHFTRSEAIFYSRAFRAEMRSLQYN